MDLVIYTVPWQRLVWYAHYSEPCGNHDDRENTFSSKAPLFQVGTTPMRPANWKIMHVLAQIQTTATKCKVHLTLAA
jgi:hypothetical protein